MIYLYGWLAIGVVTLILVLGAHLLKREKESDSVRELLDAAMPERKTLSYRLLNNIVAPVLTAVLIVVAWPAAIYIKAKELRSRTDDLTITKNPEFAVEPTHLRERFTVEEVERREIVMDPLGAVPPLPFGHLHPAWQRFLDDLPEEAEIWSFSAQWENSWGRPELREGYVAVYGGRAGVYVVTLFRPIGADA